MIPQARCGFAGGTRITLATSGSVELSQDTWYRMIVEAPEDPLDSAKTKITIKLFAMSDLVTPIVQLGPTSTTSFGSISGAPDDYTGRWGLVTYESVGQFSHFNIEHYTEAVSP